MYQLVLVIHVFVAVCVVALVLVQQGRGATVGAAFGSGASQTVFGSRGSGSFLFRVTMSLVAVFFITSIGLNYMVSKAYKQAQANVNVLPFTPPPAKSAQPPVTVPGTDKITLPIHKTDTNEPAAPAVTQPIETPSKK